MKMIIMKIIVIRLLIIIKTNLCHLLLMIIMRIDREINICIYTTVTPVFFNFINIYSILTLASARS